jgi:hypothetical protein
VARNAKTDEVKYFVSNASANTPVEEILRCRGRRKTVARGGPNP